MKISEAWLREWVNPSETTADLVSKLTMAGLEVDAVEPAAPAFSGVVVGQIESIAQHPDADKLRVCQVSDGSATVQVVCGAANAAAGLKIPFATVGAQLPGGLSIKAAKLRGVASNGMLCGASELGLEDIVDGLLVLDDDATLGTDIRDYLKLDDPVIEVDLTPNRGDCLSVLGVAREVGVLTASELTPHVSEPVAAAIDDTVAISIAANDYCTRYAGRVIRNVDVKAETPLWMREKLRRAGLRSIDPVVDVTNYVLLETGQPMHAFDLEKINGGLNVRRANAGEKVALLDASEATLTAEHLVIADDRSALAVAGIMGGKASAVSTSTQHILLESAFFEPSLHAGKARELGLHTDSSHRFERGVDRQGQQRAIDRATELLLDIVGGEPGPVTIVESAAASEKPATVELTASRIQRVLGFSMPAEQVNDIFERLGFNPQGTAAGWSITVPPHRFDLEIEADLLEELARIYGYDNLPVEPPLAAMEFSLKPESQQPLSLLKSTLASKGYNEVITYSFIDPAISRAYFPDQQVVEVANPIASDMAVMRISLIPGLVKAAQHNISRQRERIQCFEAGLRFVVGDNGLSQQPMIAGLLCGTRFNESWLSKSEAVVKRNSQPDSFDFYDLKGDVEALLARGLGGAAEAVVFRAPAAGSLAYLHPGQSAEVVVNEQKIGVLGLLHPKLARELGVTSDIWVFELQSDLISRRKVPEFKELSKFPEVRRDLAIIADQSVSVGELVDCIKAQAPDELVGLVVFDQYTGEGVGDGKQSVGLGLTWQHAEKTLNDEEVTALTNTVIETLQKAFAVSLR